MNIEESERSETETEKTKDENRGMPSPPALACLLPPPSFSFSSPPSLSLIGEKEWVSGEVRAESHPNVLVVVVLVR